MACTIAVVIDRSRRERNPSAPENAMRVVVFVLIKAPHEHEREYHAVSLSL